MLLDELIESGGNLQKGIELNTKLSDAKNQSVSILSNI